MYAHRRGGSRGRLLQPRQAFFAPTAIPQSLPLEWRTPSSLPPGGGAVLNDTPAACQTREPTDPQGDRCSHIPAASAATYPLRCFAPQWARFDNHQKRPAYQPLSSHCISGSGAGIVSRPGASAFFVSDGPISSNSGRNGGKNAGRNCVSALPQRAMPVHCHPRFPSRNRRFPDRCRSPDCASTAFRCRCLLLRQKLFVLPCRRLRNNYILCPTGTPTFAAARRQRRDLIIAIRSAHQPLSSHCISGSGASGTSDP